jgi:hypothetical protein
MLKCKGVSEESSSFIDNTLPWHRRAKVIFHLAICHNCRRFIRHLRVSVKIGIAVGREGISKEEAQVVARKAMQK